MTEGKKKILKLGISILGLIIIAFCFYLILKAVGVTDIDTFRELIASTGGWGPVVFVIIQILVTTFLCFIPGTSAMFIGFACVIWPGDEIWKAMVICSIAVFLSSALMFFIGNKLGEKAVIKLVGEKDLRKAQDLVDTKSKILLPLMFMFPVFPDDALCMVSGLTKMRYRYFLPVAAIFRTTGVITICLLARFGDVFQVENWRFIDWVIVINLVLFDIYAVVQLTKWLEKRIEAFRNKRRIVKDDPQIDDSSDLKE